MIEGVQTTLDGLGLIPGVGELFDGTNAAIYASRGDAVNAGLSLGAMVPFIGWSATGGKLLKKVPYIYKANEALVKAIKAAKRVSNIAKNGRKMSLDEIGNFLNAGKNWHKGSAKNKFLKQFKKELKGDTNADFWIDKKTNEVFLKSNKSGNWINTGQKFE